MQNKISVIVPVYNSEEHLDRCIKSILNQKDCDIELVIVNDGSTDNSELIIQKYSQLHSNICYIKQTNNGVSSARNLGLQKATGNYITFVDSDDYVDDDYCSTMLNGLLDNDADICTCRAIDHHIGTGNTTAYPESDNVKLLSSDEYSFFDDSLQKAVCCVLLKKEIVNGIQFRNDLFVAEDSVFLAECIHRANKIAVLYKNLYHYMIFPQSTSHGEYDAKKKTELTAWKAVAEINKDKPYVYETCLSRYADRCLKIIRKYFFKMGIDKDYYKFVRKEYRNNLKFILKVNHKKYSASKMAENAAYLLFAAFPFIYPVYYNIRYKEKS